MRFTQSVVSGMKYAVPAAFLISAHAYAATYTPVEAAKHIGADTAVEGVASVYVSKGGTIFVDLGGSGTSAPFTGVIFADKASAFPNITSYNGKTVYISGTIKEYRGKPEIILSSPSQIHVK